MADSKLQKMAEKKQWDKLRKKLRGADHPEYIEVAQTLASSGDEEAFNLLVSFTNHTEASIRIEAEKALGEMGYNTSSQITRLLWLLEKAEADNAAEEIEVLKTAITKLRNRK